MYNDEKQWQLDFSGILLLFLRCSGSFYNSKYWDQFYVKLSNELSMSITTSKFWFSNL